MTALIESSTRTGRRTQRTYSRWASLVVLCAGTLMTILDGNIVTVRLKRARSTLRAVCAGCDTEFVYRRPSPSTIAHFKSPLLPSVKGNFDSGDDEH